MSYAALIALLAALTFTMPFLVDLAEHAGVPRGFGIVTTLVAAIFAIAWITVRSRVQRRQAVEARMQAIRDRIKERPQDPTAFYRHGDHLGDLLLTLGRVSEALRAFEAYRRVAEQSGGDTTAVNKVIARLRRDARSSESSS